MSSQSKSPLRIVRRVVVFCCLAVTAFAATEAWAGRYFSIRTNGKLIGYASVSERAGRDNGRDLLTLDSVTSIKVAVLGKERKILIQAKTVIDAETRRPILLSMTTRTNDAVQHVDVEFSAEEVAIWAHGADDERPAAKKIKVPDGTLLLGGNVFAHWDLILHAARRHAKDGAVKLSVLLPEVQQVDEIKLVRVGEKRVTVAGQPLNVVVWKLGGAGVELWADAANSQLVRMAVAGQQTVIERTEESVVKLLEKTQAEEVFADRFASSNVRFDDFLAVRMMKARIKATVIGEGIANADSVLQTSMQKFKGKKEGAAIEGVVEIRSIEYDPKTSPAADAAAAKELREWTTPSQYIESDNSAIAARAKQLAAGGKTRWDVVKQIGDWVYKEIRYTIADTPSASLALEKREGDCGPHSTLMVAMLRSLGIPAKLVGGVVYTPSFGGSFGQHAWVEVYMGPAGWVTVDPTTGEFDTMSAVHIKLFEGMGGATLDEVEVLAFDPPNRDVSVSTPQQVRPIPWKLGTTYRLRYRQGENDLGYETFTVREIDYEDGKALELRDELELKISAAVSLTSKSRLIVRSDMRPLLLDRTLAAGRETRIICRFKGDRVVEEISGSRAFEREIDIPKGAYCFDNNLTASLALICSQLTLKVGEPVRIQTFHPSSLQVIPLTITPQIKETIEVAGETVECFRCKVDPIANIFWISKDGRLVKAVQGNLTIELVPTE